ncbi:Ctr copper transporter family-domain-containing protein [Lyophyllum atratum]|nr:Ctr copper transporter family-domain-containing protein [Lyophyllum atratum]
MDHGAHGGHDMPMGHTCSMNMLWNTQIIDTCIVFRSWHIKSYQGFIFSCLVIVALGAFYEYLREFQKKYDVHLARSLADEGKGKGRASPRGGSGRSSPDTETEERGLLSGRRLLKPSSTGTPVPIVARLVRASMYGATVFLSFFLMLVFMTYNAYLIIAVVLGAAIGHYIFGSTLNVNAVLGDAAGPKTMACH